MISVSYFGKSNTPSEGGSSQAKTPVWSKSWNRSPFNKGVNIDWKTGTIRTPLFEEEEAAPVQAVSNTVINTGSNSVIAKITGGDAVSGYTLQCYPNYPDLSTGAFYAKALIPAISLGGHVVTTHPSDIYIIAHYISLNAIGGN